MKKNEPNDQNDQPNEPNNQVPVVETAVQKYIEAPEMDIPVGKILTLISS